MPGLPSRKLRVLPRPEAELPGLGPAGTQARTAHLLGMLARPAAAPTSRERGRGRAAAMRGCGDRTCAGVSAAPRHCSPGARQRGAALSTAVKTSKLHLEPTRLSCAAPAGPPGAQPGIFEGPPLQPQPGDAGGDAPRPRAWLGGSPTRDAATAPSMPHSPTIDIHVSRRRTPTVRAPYDVPLPHCRAGLRHAAGRPES